MASLYALMAMAVSGARSVPVYGWMREECEGAALLALARYKPTTAHEAFWMGRYAALDELRRLSGGRRGGPRYVKVPLLEDHEPPDEAELEAQAELEARAVQRERILRWAAHRTPRTREVVEAMLEGRTGEQAARHVGLDPSRVSQLLRVSRVPRSSP
jgi:DNA-directed RNA polymerase specialized sigma24 family protein